MLHGFIAINREEIIRRCKGKVATRLVSPLTDAEIDHGVRLALDGLVDVSRLTLHPESGRSALQQAHDPLFQGLSWSRAVLDYGDVCQSIIELAMEMNAPINSADFPGLNRSLNGAAGAVTVYERQRDQSSPDAVTRGDKPREFFPHASQTRVNPAIGSFEVLRTGSVGVAGRTGRVLYRSFIGLRSLIRSLGDVRFTHGVSEP